MAERLPSAQRIRYLLSAETVDESLFRRTAEALFNAGRLHEALAFQEKVSDEPLLERIKARAIEEGDAFVLRWAGRISTTNIVPDDWKRLADKARSLGKEAFAKQADEMASSES